MQATSMAMYMLAQASSTVDAVQSAIEALRASLTWDFGSYYEVDAAGQSLVYEFASGELSAGFEQGLREHVAAKGEGALGRAWASSDVAVATIASITQRTTWPGQGVAARRDPCGDLRARDDRA